MTYNIFKEVKNSPNIKYQVINLLPGGKIHGVDYVARNPTRNDKTPGSFRINSRTGQWIDHATGDRGSDITSLCAYLKGYSSQYEAACYLLGRSSNFKGRNFTANPPKVSKVPKVFENTKQYINKIWDESLNAESSVVEKYLKSRGYIQRIPENIRYHTNLKHTPTQQYFPVMLAAITKWPNEEIIGLHRTFLKTDGSNKADVERNKMMIGQAKGGAVMLTPANSKLIITEGIETALSVYAATGFSTWAALSAGGMENVQIPPVDITQEIIIAADGDKPGRKAAYKLAMKLLNNGYKTRIAIPPEEGTDFNDLLKEQS